MAEALVGRVALDARVIETIVKRSVKSVEGVVCLGVRESNIDRIKRMISSEESPDLVEVYSADNKTLQVGVHVTVAFGSNVNKIAKQIREIVHEVVRIQAGVDVTRVDVYIEDIEI